MSRKRGIKDMDVERRGCELRKMTLNDIDGVMEIERASFGDPWTEGMFREELTIENSYYIAALIGGAVVGYCGMRHVVNEGHVMNIAVSPSRRREGVGRALLEGLSALASAKEMMGLTLEVRVGNSAAVALYESFGFVGEGVRKAYYDDGEDALIMWKYFVEGERQ